MKIRAKNGGQTVDITLPATDMDMQYCMKCINANIRMYRNDHLKMYKITL